MATDNNQLRARVQPAYAEHISALAQERYDGTETDAERAVIEAGLESMGFIERPTESHELFLWYVNRAGLTFGLVGLIMMGYGVFGPRLHSVIGFGLLLTGFLFLALDEGIQTYANRNGGEVRE